MKTFITDEQLLEMKYSPNSKYYGWYMVDIFLKEFEKRDYHEHSFLIFASCFYHRLVDVENNIWEIKFSDNSYCLLKICGNEYAKGFIATDFSSINHFFPE